MPWRLGRLFFSPKKVDGACDQSWVERIHPFSDGNGRVGRLLMLKECLRSGITPFIITEDIRLYYIRGLREYANVTGYLEDTCGFAQDRFEATYMPMAQEFMRVLRDTRSS